MSCFKCGAPGAKERERKHSTAPAGMRGTIALCDPCAEPRAARPGNPAYWRFRDLCVDPR